ncbi:MAG: DUF433 domain-containing protein [Thermomicrobiales bacterium]
MAQMKHRERISQDSAVLVGKPVIRGTRISVELILDWLSEDMDLEELFAAYPRLTREDVQAAIAFARDAVREDYLRSRYRKEAFAAGRKRAERAPAEV